MFGEQVFNGLSWGSLEVAETGARAGTGARVGAWAFRTVLRISYKSFLEYFEILVAAAGDFGLKSPAGYLENSDLGRREKLGGATE